MLKIASTLTLLALGGFFAGCVVQSDSESGSVLNKMGSAYKDSFEDNCQKILLQRDDGRRFTMVRGERTLISLPEKPSTGYMWELESPRKNNTFVGIQELTPKWNKNDKQLPGGSRNRQFELTAKNPGVVKIRLEEKRQWEVNKKNSDEFEITVRVVNRR
ncbi:MAG: protease inhibitor I42 family protein [Victivallaceae bacterium]